MQQTAYLPKSGNVAISADTACTAKATYIVHTANATYTACTAKATYTVYMAIVQS